MKTNKVKERLRAGEVVYGCFLRYPDATLVDVMGYQDWDFFVFDGEHGTLEPRDCEHLVRAAELHDLTPVVRVPANLPPVILRLMDTGAQGLHVPMVNSSGDAEDAVRAVKYHPRGNRGLASVRAADFAQAGTFQEYIRRANHETLVVVHIETREAVERLPEIVAVDGVDVVFIGPTDLSHSLGVAGELDHPSLRAAMEEITGTVASSRAALGVMVGDARGGREWRERGAQYITVTFESMLTPSVRSYLQAVREGC